MDLIVRQETQKMQQEYSIYLKILSLCKEACEKAMKNGDEFCIFRVPRRFEEFISFDRWHIGELVKQTLEDKFFYQAALFQEQEDIYLWIQWTEAQLFHEKRKIYENIYKKCDAAIRSYVESDLYRIGKRKTFFYHIPKGCIDDHPFEPCVAAKFISVVLKKRNFVAIPLMFSSQEAGVYIDWSHVS